MKVIAGTLRPFRDAEEALPLPASEVLPPAPDWLPNAQAAREYERLGGVLLAIERLHDGNVGALALLAAVHGRIVQCISGGVFPPASLIAQYRGLAGDLGLTSVVRTPSAAKPENRFNKFQNNGRRQEGLK